MCKSSWGCCSKCCKPRSLYSPISVCSSINVIMPRGMETTIHFHQYPLWHLPLLFLQIQVAQEALHGVCEKGVRALFIILCDIISGKVPLNIELMILVKQQKQVKLPSSNYCKIIVNTTRPFRLEAACIT